ncbi:hypothetical protein [Paraglaciecola chathamensis]|uniref:hypothetical protein n=1 Tax=Paraglaciecola chathamensis TaxID=368405 RepID=UPI0036311F6B
MRLNLTEVDKNRLLRILKKGSATFEEEYQAPENECYITIKDIYGSRQYFEISIINEDCFVVYQNNKRDFFFAEKASKMTFIPQHIDVVRTNLTEEEAYKYANNLNKMSSESKN